MPIYDIDISFNFNLVLEPADVYDQPLTNFTHVRPIPIEFVTQISGINTWKDYGTLNAEINANPIIPSVNNLILYKGLTFNLTKTQSLDVSFTDFVTDDLIPEMYTTTMSSITNTAQTLVNASMSNTIFTEDIYNKLRASFNIENGFTNNDGFGYLGTRVITGLSNLDGDAEDKILGIIFHQSSVVLAQSTGV
jgi:hypothetical protein